MKLLGACILAFSMYSRVPTPKANWNKKSMEFLFCFFPLVGAILGAIFIIWFWIADFLHLGTILTATVSVAIPILFTGGIHLDGFCDTSDALASYGSKEKKLEILKDSHIGAFALISCVVYIICQFGLLCQFIEDNGPVGILAVVFTLSRALSAFGVITKKNARGSGMLATFTDALSGRLVLLSVIIWIAACVIIILWIDLLGGIAAICGSAVVFIYYGIVSLKKFGGITGDLAGYFLQLCELGALASVVLAGRLVAVL